jgi:hypothetical protein
MPKRLARRAVCDSAWNKGSSLFGGLRSSAFRSLASPILKVTRGSALLFGISSSALPSWDQENEAAQSDSRPDRGSRGRHKSPGELASSIVPRGTATAKRAELVCLIGANIYRTGQVPADTVSFVQRNSVPSLHMRCMMTARRRASATMAFCRPRRLAMFIAHAFNDDHFVTRVSMT